MPNRSLPPVTNTAAMAERLFRMGQTAWLDYHKRSVGGALSANRVKNDQDNPFDALVAQIILCLEAGRDDLVNASVAHAHSVGAEDVGSEIIFAAEEAATTVKVGPDKQTWRTGCGCYLYAFPVVVHSDVVLPERLTSPRVLMALEDSITRFELFYDNPDVFMLDRLFTLQEIDALPYSVVRQLTKSMMAREEMALPVSMSVFDGKKPERAQLRFVIFSVRQETNDDKPPTEDPDAFDERQQQWLDFVTGLLSTQLMKGSEDGFLTVGILDDLYEAKHVGKLERSNAELISYMADLTRDEQARVRITEVHIAPFGKSGVTEEIRLAFVGNNGTMLLGYYSYPMHKAEETEEALVSCGGMARDFGFAKVKLYAQVQDDSGCLENELRLVINHPSASTLPAIPFPTSQLVH